MLRYLWQSGFFDGTFQGAERPRRTVRALFHFIFLLKAQELSGQVLAQTDTHFLSLRCCCAMTEMRMNEVKVKFIELVSNRQGAHITCNWYELFWGGNVKDNSTSPIH